MVVYLLGEGVMRRNQFYSKGELKERTDRSKNGKLPLSLLGEPPLKTPAAGGKGSPSTRRSF